MGLERLWVDRVSLGEPNVGEFGPIGRSRGGNDAEICRCYLRNDRDGCMDAVRYMISP